MKPRRKRWFLLASTMLLCSMLMANETSVRGLALGQSLAPFAPPGRSASIHLLVAMDWQGRDLLAHNLEALQRFREQYTDIAITHFIDPAYFARSEAEAQDARHKIRQAMRPGDQVGMSIAGWRSLALRSGVVYRSEPTFWGNTLKSIDCAKDCGLDVPLHIQPQEDLARLMHTGLDLMQKRGFGRPKGLMVEGWLATPELLDTAIRAGFRYDVSSVATELLSYRMRLFPIYGWVRGLWPNVTPHSQPYLRQAGGSELTEIPQSLAALDFAAKDDVINIFKEYVDLALKQPGTDLVFPLVLYQETAQMSLPQLAHSLAGIFAYASKMSVTIRPLTMTGLELPRDTLESERNVNVSDAAPLEPLPLATVNGPQAVGPPAPLPVMGPPGPPVQPTILGH